MANNIYHKSNWGSPEKDGWGDVYFNPSATNKLYSRSDNYENSDGTDKALDKKPDTQSILMTPTAYDVGSMNSVLPPYEVLPTELVTNGDFATDSDWSKGTGWSIANGIASCDGTQTDGTQLTQTELTFTKNRTYKVVFTCTVQAGNLDARLQGSGATVTGDTITTSGTYTQYLVSTGNTSFRMRGNSDFVGTVDNVSVKEVISADFTFDRSSTATRVNKDGYIETVAADVPRLDYPLIDGVVQDCPSLLLEPSRTNLVAYSEDFSDSSWTKSGPTLTYNQGTSPDGNNNATKMIPSTSSTSQDIFATVTASGSTAYTRSFFAKADGYNWIYIQQYDASTNLGAWFDLSTGSLGNTETNITSSIENYGNGWYKCSVTFTTQSGATNERAQIRVVGSNGATTFAGNGTDGILIWGAQVESASYPTSYIPTSGSAVTRNADVCDSAGTSAEFNDSEGVLYAEVSALADDGTSRRISLSNGSASNTIEILLQNTGRVDYQVKSGNVFQGGGFFNLTQTEYNKIAVKYKTNDLALWVDGFERTTDTSATMPSGLNELAFDNGGGGADFYGRTKEVAAFKSALTDSELEQLTSWDSFTEMATGQEYSIR